MNALVIFMVLQNRVFKKFLDEFVIVFIDHIFVYVHTREVPEELRMILDISMKKHR